MIGLLHLPGLGFWGMTPKGLILFEAMRPATLSRRYSVTIWGDQ